MKTFSNFLLIYCFLSALVMTAMMVAWIISVLAGS